MGKSDSDSSSNSSSEEEKKEKKEKKPKTKKPKVVLSSSQSFSKRYASSFNNKQFSDFTVQIGNESIAAHKFVLCNNSEFFAKLENESSFTFPKEDDENAAKSLIKFFYTGSFEYTDDSAVVIFTILANKYKTKNFNEFKLPAKVLLNGVISYIEKDLTNRLSEFDTLCESVDFKKMEKEDLTKLYAKKKWLQKSSSFLNQIILKDMEDSEEGSDKDSEDGSDKSEEEEEEEEEEEGGGLPKFLPKKSCQNAYKFEKKDRKLTTLTNAYWAANAIATKATKYAVKFITNCNDMMIGFAPPTLNVNQSNYTSCGWYLYTTQNSLYSQDGDSSRSFSSTDYNAGAVYGFLLNTSKGTITIFKNGQSLGLAYTLKDKKIAKKLIPNINTYYSNQTLEFVKFKGKK